MSFLNVLWGEILKLRRSKLTWITLFIMVAAGVVLNGFLWIVGNPGVAASLGLLGQKASFTFGNQPVGWPVLVSTLLEMGGLGNMLLGSFILAWLFGREYQLGTAKNLLVLPLPRAWFVVAKVLVALAWMAVLTAVLWVTAGWAARFQDLAAWSPSLLAESMGPLVWLWLTSFAVSLPVAWIAVASRGVFAPLGYAIGTLVFASMFGHLGWGPYVPWSIISIQSGAAGPGMELNLASWLVVGGTGLLGLGLTINHQMNADNNQ